MTRFMVDRTNFERPENFNGSDNLKQLFEIWSVAGGFSRQLVRVELEGYPSRLAEIPFKVGRLEEVPRWVLSFGSQPPGSPGWVKWVRSEIDAMNLERKTMDHGINGILWSWKSRIYLPKNDTFILHSFLIFCVFCEFCGSNLRI